MIAIRKTDGQIFEVQKYIKSDTEISIWCNDWYGRHVVGQDCELYPFDKRHEKCDLGCMSVCTEGFTVAPKCVNESKLEIAQSKSIPVQFAVWLSLSDTAREYYDRHTTLTEDNISELYDIFTEEKSIKP